MKLSIVKYPNKILRAKGKEIKFPLTPEIKKLIRDMLDTVKESSGVGLAAPQVNNSLSLIVVNLEHLGIKAFPLINPSITKYSKRTVETEEGCLSIPGVYGLVERPEKITVKAKTVKGEPVVFECDGMLATVIQHEIDHTNGVLIIDKITKYTQGEEELKQLELM